MATMHDVAKRADVSLSTVSYALSGSRPVSSATKLRIEQAMAELGYQPNAMARGLAARRSRVLALIYPATERGLGGTVAEFVSSAAATAREHGYHLVLWPFGPHQASEIRDLAQQGMADGILVMEVAIEDARVDALIAAGIPVTMIGRTRELAGRSYVDIDFERTIEDAVAHLVGIGHRQIAFINHSRKSVVDGYAPTLRAGDTYRAAMESRGLVPVEVLCDEVPEAGRRAVEEVFDRAAGTTAFVTMNEIATFGVTVELQDRGLRVPEDVSILAVVTSPGVGAMSNPPLTTMHAPGAELGRRGALALLALVEGGAPLDPVLITCGLEPGASVAPVAARDAG